MRECTVGNGPQDPFPMIGIALMCSATGRTHGREKEISAVTINDVFQRLVAIADASNGGARGGTILVCDMLHQDALYSLQESLATLLADVANACGPIQARALATHFPGVFENR
jgi:hypothetical protein